MSWSDDKELSSAADAIGWNSLSKKQKKQKKTCLVIDFIHQTFVRDETINNSIYSYYIYIYIYLKAEV